MFPYIVIYVCSGIFALCYSKSKDKSASVIFLLLTFFVLFVPAALRYNIGTDYKNYVRIISNNLPRHRYTSFEVGWIPVLWLMDNLNLPVHAFFVLIDFTILFCLFTVLDKKAFWLCIPIYVSFAYIQSYSLVRQALAATIFLLAVKHWIARKYMLTILFGVISFLFHKSTVFLCVLLILANFKWKLLSRRNNCVLVVIIYLLIDKLKLASLLMDTIVGNTFYSSYIQSSFNMSTEGSGLGSLFRELLLFVVVIASSRTVNKWNTSNRLPQSRLYTVSILFSLAGISFFILSTQIHIFNRLPCLIIPFLVITVQCVYRSKYRYRKLALLLLEVGWFFSFVLYIKESLISNPGGLGITPYQSIFSR